MRSLLLGLAALLPLAACAPTPGRNQSAPDAPRGKIDPNYRDIGPDTDPAIPRLTPQSRSPAQQPTVPIYTD